MVKSFWAILDGFRLQAGVAVVLLGTTGFLEGLALVALIPALSVALSNEAKIGSMGYVEHLLGYFSISHDHVVHVGLAVFAVLGLTTALFRLVAEASMLRIRTKVEESARRRMSEALLRMSWSKYLAMRLGDISKSMLSEAVQMSVGSHLFLQGVGAILVALGYLGVATAISLKMTIFTLVFGLVGGVAYYLSWKGSRRHTRELSKLMTNIGDEVSTIFSNLKFFRATGRSQAVGAKGLEIYRYYAKTYFWSQVFGNIMRFGFETGAVVFITTFLAMAILVYQQPVASALIFLAVFYRLAPRLLTVQENFFQARTYLPWYETWRSRMDGAQSAVEHHSGKGHLPSFRELCLHGVQFAYSERKAPVLQGLDLNIKRGKCVAIVGKSGSGKSTVVDLATRLLTPSKGTVEVNSVDLRDIDVEFWRSKIGLVLQDSPVFYGTVLENIAWGEQHPDRARAERVAKLANAWDFIESLPSGLNTQVGEKGGAMSGGQRQRIALARALYRDPWLLILDEATSALDGHSEAAVQEALRSLKGKCAILMVAHRLITVQMADWIVVLDGGRVIEQGTWADLLKRKRGAFRQMAELQGVDVQAA